MIVFIIWVRKIYTEVPVKTGLIAPQKFHHGLGARLDMQLFINRVQMRPHGAQADTELIGDFLVKIAFGPQRQNFKRALPAWTCSIA